MSQGPTSDAKADTDLPELWQFVPLPNYSRPEQAAASAAVAALTSLKHIFRNSPKEESPVMQEDKLRSLPEVQLEHLVHPIDWSTVSCALDTGLSEQIDDSSASPGVRFVIGQPHCGHADIVTAWAARHGAQVIVPPSQEEILASEGNWPVAWPAAGQAWALPSLERCFLRHASGLALVRKLLEDVASGRAGTGLIGCDSWAWAYLQRVSSLPQPAALTLQAFDGPRLSRLFSQLATPKGRQQLHFRNARSGRDTLTVPYEGDSVSDEIVKLAAHCRGNVGTARSYWRQRLRAIPEPEADVNAAKSTVPGEAGPDAKVIWVSATLPEPALPAEANEDVAIVLHALLLHNGLTDAALREVVPLPHHLSVAIVLRLQRQSLLEQREGRWIVSAPGYELVRQWLRGRDFLTDGF